MVKPIILRDNQTGEEYTLEFSRSSVRYAEQNGFKIKDIDEKPMTATTDLFFYAFRMHHPTIKREKVDKILFDDLGGLSTEIITRLAELYAEPFNALLPDEDERKNSRVAVEL